MNLKSQDEEEKKMRTNEKIIGKRRERQARIG